MTLDTAKNKNHIENSRREMGLHIIIFVLFVLYIFLVFKITLFKYASLADIFAGKISGFRSLNLIPFDTVKSFFNIAAEYGGYLWAFSNIIGNVLIMVPFGFCVPLLWPRMRTLRWTALAVVVLSLSIELLQYSLSLGAADIDDMIMNTLGGLLGYLVYKLLRKLTKTRLALYILTLLIAVSMFVIGFAVAHEQFGGLLGLVEYKTITVGDENIPKTPPDYSGTVARWEDGNLVIYDGRLTGADDPNLAYAKEVILPVDEQTDFYAITSQTENYTTTISYNKLSLSDAGQQAAFSGTTVWLDSEGNVMTAVFMEPLSSGSLITTTAPTDFIKPKSTDEPQGQLAPNNTDNPAVSSPPRKADIPSIGQEVVQGHITGLSDGKIEIELISNSVLEDGTYISTTTGIPFTVQYTEDTSFTVKTIRDGGISQKDVETRPGSPEDLAAGTNEIAECMGEWQGDAFVATDIMINQIIW